MRITTGMPFILVTFGLLGAMSEASAGKLSTCRELCRDEVERCGRAAVAAAGCAAGTCPKVARRMRRSCRRVIEHACRSASPLACDAATPTTTTTTTPATSIPTTTVVVLASSTTTTTLPVDPLCARTERALSPFEESWTARVRTSGDGFLVLRDEDRLVFTQAAGLQLAADGHVVDLQGLPLQGVALDDDWRPVGSTRDVDVSAAGTDHRATTRIDVVLTLDDSLPTIPIWWVETSPDSAGNVEFGRTVWDENGAPRSVTFVVARVGERAWHVATYLLGSDLEDADGEIVFVDQRTIEFDADGEAVPAGQHIFMSDVHWAGTAQPISIDIDLGGLRQGAPNPDWTIDADGYGPSPMVGLQLLPDGELLAVRADGRFDILYRIVTATFASPAGLDPCGPGYFLEDSRSGPAGIAFPGVLWFDALDVTGRLR